MSNQETTDTERGQTPVYRARTLAYLDVFSGVVKVTVLEVIKPGDGFRAAGGDMLGEIKVRVNATVGAYERGEVLTERACKIVPRSHLRYRGGSARINSLYAWR